MPTRARPNSMAHFLHAADLHLGRVFGSIGGEPATQLHAARFQVVESIVRTIGETGATFVVVAGDLFDSRNPSGAVVAGAMEAIGKVPVPVYAIPGNHDPAGPYGPYESEKFVEYSERFAPNFHLLDAAEPVLVPGTDAVLLPCPATGRPGSDPTAWLRELAQREDLAPESARIGIAHGGTLAFPGDVEQSAEINLERLDRAAIDYLALGDWHGTLHLIDKAYRYAGTPEADRFPKGEDYRNGLLLEVRAGRGREPEITEHRIGRYAWRVERRTLRSAEDVRQLDTELLAAHEQSGRLLRLELDGSLGIAERAELDRTCDRLRDVYLHLDIDQSALGVVPTEQELEALAGDVANPATSAVATRLAGLLDDPDRGEAARLALVKLHEAVAR